MKVRPMLIGIAIGFSLTQIFNLFGNFTIWFPIYGSLGYNWGLTILTTATIAAIPFFLGALYAVLAASEKPFRYGVLTGFLTAIYFVIPAFLSIIQGLAGQFPANVTKSTLQGNFSMVVVTLLCGLLMGSLASLLSVRLPWVRSLKRFVI